MMAVPAYRQTKRIVDHFPTRIHHTNNIAARNRLSRHITAHLGEGSGGRGF